MRLICDLTPHVSDAVSLGTSSLMFSDLFVASGSVINFNNGDVTLTHSSNALTVGGGDVGIGITPVSNLHVYENSTGTGTGSGITVENDGTGDAIVQYLLTGTKRWVTGIDNSDSDNFKIASSADLGSDTEFVLDSSGNGSFAGSVTATSLDINGAADISGALTGVDALTMSGILDITGTTDSSNATGDTGILRCEGGASIAKKLYVGSTITGSADVIAFSDRKLKDNIETLDGKKVLDMRGVSFTRKDTGLPSSGVIAQEIQKVAPELVHDTEGTLGVAYGNLVGYLIEAVKDQQKQIDELKAMCNGCSK